MRLLEFDYTIAHIPGKEMHTADVLSTKPQKETDNSSPRSLSKVIVEHEILAMELLPASPDMLENIKAAQENDPVLTRIREYCTTSWPKEVALPPDVQKYSEFAHELTQVDGISLKERNVRKRSEEDDVPRKRRRLSTTDEPAVQNRSTSSVSDVLNEPTANDDALATIAALRDVKLPNRTAGVAEKFPQPAKMVAGSGHQYPRGSDGDCVYARRRATSSCELTAAAHPEGLEHGAARGCYNIHQHR
ncbi:hypothetical protein MRX96_043990 [Rhipicephalus microplus]